MKQKMKPRLRGVSHQIALFLAIFGAGFLLPSALQANSHHPYALTGFLLYGVSLVALFAISALYHRPTWKPGPRALMRRLDHCAISFLIAGSSSAVAAMTLTGADLSRFLWISWLGAAAGIGTALFWITAPKPVTAITYVAVAFAASPYFGQIAAAMSPQSGVLLVVGGALYICGAAIYGLRRPDPWPRTFGYHEIFHALVVLAAACHYVAIWGLLQNGT